MTGLTDGQWVQILLVAHCIFWTGVGLGFLISRSRRSPRV